MPMNRGWTGTENKNENSANYNAIHVKKNDRNKGLLFDQ